MLLRCFVHIFVRSALPVHVRMKVTVAAAGRGALGTHKSIVCISSEIFDTDLKINFSFERLVLF